MGRRRDHPAARGRAARAFADRPHGAFRAARRGCETVDELGAGVWPARRGAGPLGDDAWTPPTGFGRQFPLTRQRSSRSSAAASAIPGVRRAFARRSASPWTFGLVAEGKRGVAGYLIAREVAGTGEVLNLAVAPEFRRRGIGGALLACRAHGAPATDGWKRSSSRCANRTARRSRSIPATGFRPVGQRAGYYRNPKEDALVLAARRSSGLREPGTIERNFG